MERLFLLVCLCTTLEASAAGQTVLQIQTTRATEGQVTLPVTIEGNPGQGVAALNFELAYDPQYLRVLELAPGQAAQQAGKQVQWHQVAPGRINVVVTGFNQATLTGGQVALLTVEPLKPDSQQTRLHVRNPTFSSESGDIIPSRGSTGTVSWNDSSTKPTPAPGVGTPAVPPTIPPRGVTPEPPAAPILADTALPAVPDGPEVAAAVHQQLAAARNNAEAARAMLGRPRTVIAASETGGQAPPAMVGAPIGDMEPRRLAQPQAQPAGQPVKANSDAPGTLGPGPKKDVENDGRSRHNGGSSDVPDTSDTSRYRALVMVGVAIALAAVAVGLRRI